VSRRLFKWEQNEVRYRLVAVDDRGRAIVVADGPADRKRVSKGILEAIHVQQWIALDDDRRTAAAEKFLTDSV